jgi:hypothetical protein
MPIENHRTEFAKYWRRSLPIAALVVLLLMQSPDRLSFAQSPKPDGGPSCAGDTVDRMGPEIAAQSRAFLERLGKTAQADDQRQVASMLQYPIDVHIADKKFPVHNPEEFLRNYSRIMNRSVKAAILDEKSSRCLFHSSEGFMVGDGEVWFKEISPGVFKVITFNLGDVPNGTPER